VSSSVGSCVRSPHHFWLNAFGLKSRLSRSGRGLAVCLGGSRRGSGLGRTDKPWAALEATTVFFVRCSPPGVARRSPAVSRSSYEGLKYRAQGSVELGPL
jgi:hypothetical protein